MFTFFKKKKNKQVVENKVFHGHVVKDNGDVYMSVYEYTDTGRIAFKFSNHSYEIMFDRKALPQFISILNKI